MPSETSQYEDRGNTVVLDAPEEIQQTRCSLVNCNHITMFSDEKSRIPGNSCLAREAEVNGTRKKLPALLLFMNSFF